LKIKPSKPIKIEDQFPIAVRYYEDGKIDAAKHTLEEMLKDNPKDYDVLIFLGGICFNSENYDKSAAYYERAIALIENHPTAHYNLALSYHKLDKLTEAENYYKKTLLKYPNHTDALNNLGVIYASQNNNEDALKFYNQVLEINPRNSQALNNIGNLFSQTNKYDEAEVYYNKAIIYDPVNSKYLYNLADCCLKQKKISNAIVNLEKAIKLNGSYFEAYNSLGVCHLKNGTIGLAKEMFEKAIEINSKYWEAYQNLGLCFEKLKMNSEAVMLYKKAVMLCGNSFSPIIKLSSVLADRGDYSESEQYLKLLEKDENHKIVSYNNIGIHKLKQGNIQEALSYAEMAIKENANVAITHYNYSHALLLNGNFSEGWNEYEWRKYREEFEKRDFSKNELADQEIIGKKILVWSEQGFGDSLQFARYLVKLQEKGAYVIFECDPALASIFSSCKGINKLVLKEGVNEPSVEYDYQIALLSLPRYFNTDLHNIPAEIPYLSVSDDKIKEWEKTIKGNNNLKVGLVWAGNPNHANDKNRSCKLLDFDKLFDIPYVEFYSLQKGKPLEQITTFQNKIHNTSVQLNTFEDTAAAISNLDFVISVDTSVAHLAGALGKEVWLMLPFIPDWRWLMDREDSPWYPSMKLFRQDEKSTWQDVVERMKKELIQIVETKFGNIVTDYEQSLIVNTKSYSEKRLTLALSSGENFGWGVCSNYFKKELSGKINIDNISELKVANNYVDSDIFHALIDHDFNSITQHRGKRNIGYTFFENELTEKAVENSKKYNMILAGSTWCKEKMIQKGINKTGTLIQGVDPEMFYPVEQRKNDNLFIIFSGGKFELRKGQDLVIKAFEILHKKYLNMILVNAWYNYWPEVMKTMSFSKHIKFEFKGNTWHEYIGNLLTINNVDVNRVFILPITPGNKLRELYSKTDIGFFPNRCEGGTNLVLMEYMACGKPVIASYNSGHKDILNENNSIMLKDMKKFTLSADKKLIADWEEPSLDEIIEKIEYAYHNQDKIKLIGNNAGEFMKNYTWEKTADNLLSHISSLG